MLRFFRGGGVAQVVVGGIVSTIIVVFMVEFRAGRGPTAGFKRQCVVEFRGTCLDQKEYFAELGLVVPRGADAASIKRLGLRRKVLDGLVERELLVERARSLDLGVGEDTINAELEAGRAHVSLPASDIGPLSAQLGLCRLEGRGSCERGSERLVRQLHVQRTPNEPFDYKLYEREIRVLSNRGPREFKSMQEKELLAERLRGMVRSRVRVSPAEIEALGERAVIRSASVSRDWFAKYAVDSSDAAVDRWSFENRSQVDGAWEAEKANWTAGCSLVREVVIPMQSMAVDEEQNPLRQKANEARARLVGGEPFGDVARALSSGPAALLGGELGCLSKSYGLGYDELSKAVASLKTGEISQVIDTPRGLHVVQVEAQVDAAKLEEVGRRHVARGLYTHFAADEAAHKFASDLIERVKAGQKLEDAVREATEQAAKSRPAPAAKPHAGKTPIASPETQALAASDRPHFEVSAPFPRSGNPLPDLEPKDSIAAKAFELSKPDQIVDKPLETASGWVLFQLKERTAPEKAEAEELRATLLQYKADEAVAEYVAGLRKAAGAKLVVDGSFGEDKSRTTDDE